MIDYLWQVNIGICLLAFAYIVLFKNLSFFQLNRAIIIGIPIISMLIPFLSYSTLESLSATINLPVLQLDPVNSPLVIEEKLSKFNYLILAYQVGLMMSIFLFLLKLYKLFILIKSHSFKIEAGVKICMDEGQDSTFSFFQYIFINEFDLKDYEFVVEHEEWHYKLYHSVDKIFYELLKCVFWFNPTIYLLNRELRSNHEFDVDRRMTDKNNPATIINKLTDKNPLLREFSFTNTYKSNNNLLNRIHMLTKKPNSKIQKLQYIALIPMLMVFTFIVSCSNQEEIEESVTQVENSDLSKYSEIFPPEKLKDLSKQPEYLGGMEQMYAYIGSEIKYPEDAKKDSIDGKVFVSFVIAKDGAVTNVKVIKGVHSLLDAEAIRAISNMPNWSPGEYQGEKVAVEYMLPIMFSLN